MRETHRQLPPAHERPGRPVRLEELALGVGMRARHDLDRGIQSLRAAGVRVYEWQPSMLHAKTFVVDGRWSSIGTMNFDAGSLALNDEVSLMVLDAALGARMDAIFRDDLRHACEIGLSEFRRRPWTAHVSEWAANLLTRVP